MPWRLQPANGHLSRFFWGVVIGLGTYMIVASAIAAVVDWFG